MCLSSKKNSIHRIYFKFVAQKMLTVDSKPVCVCVRDWQNLVSNATPWRMVIQIDTRVKALTIHNEPWSFTPHKLNLIKRTLESHVSIHTTTTTNWIPPCDRVQKGKKKNLIEYMELPMERKSLTEKLHYISRVKKATSQRVGLLQRNNTRD